MTIPGDGFEVVSAGYTAHVTGTDDHLLSFQVSPGAGDFQEYVDAIDANLGDFLQALVNSIDGATGWSFARNYQGGYEYPPVTSS